MEKRRGSRDRTVLTVAAETDPSKNPRIPWCQVHSAAISNTLHSQILIYLGTENGKILVLSWDPASSEDLIVLGCRTLGRHPVESICPLRESNKVAALADNFVFVLDTYLEDSPRQLIFTKGASAVARRMHSSTTKKGMGVEVGVPETSTVGFSELGLQKRMPAEPSSWSTGQGFLQKLSRTNRKPLRSLEGSANSNVGGKLGFGRKGRNSQLAVAAGKRLFLCEILSSDNSKLKEVLWHNNKALNDAGGFSADINVREIPGPEGVVSMAWLDNSVIVGTVHGYMLITVVDGSITPIFSLPDSSGPPLLKCFPNYGEVLLIVDNVGIIVNTAGQPTAGSLLFKDSPDSLGQTGPYVLMAKNGHLELYHRKTGVRVQSLSLSVTGHSVIADADADNINEKFIVIVNESKVSCLQQVPLEEQLKELLRKKDYDDAVSLAEECVKEGEGSHAKERLSFVHAQAGFQLLFDLQFKEAVDHFLQSEAMQPSEIFPFIMPDPNRWSSLVPRNRYWGLHPPPQPLEEVIENGLLTIQRGVLLKKAGVVSEIYAVGETVPPSPSNRNVLLELAIQNIIRYLKASREKDLAPLMKEGVDTVLMYLYRVLGLTEDMEQLASSENSCVVEELEALLKDSGHLRTLAFLYSSKGLQPWALDIWRILAQRNMTITLQGSTVTRKRGQESTGLMLSQLAAATEAAHLLEESSDHELVLQHLTWIIEKDQDLGIKVLTSSKRSRPLPPDVVFSALDAKAIGVRQRYLQWLIEDQGSDDVNFHTLYALLLAKEALDASKCIMHSVTVPEDVNQKTEEFILDEGKKVSNDSFLTVEKVREEDEQNSKQFFSRSIREKLQSFLLSSAKYDAEAVLNLIKGSELWPEQAILYRKLGEETFVLQILALKLEDSDAAEQYCAELGRPEAYMQLLDMYLDPGDGKEPLYKAAVRLLHCHGELLDPLQVLEALSPDMPLQLASETLSRMLRARVHHHRQGQIVQSLSRAVNLDARLARFEERSRHVQINDESLCDACHARLGTKLFAMYPNDSVVCYKCFRRYGEHTCPVTGRDFQKDVMFKPSWLVRNV